MKTLTRLLVLATLVLAGCAGGGFAGEAGDKPPEIERTVGPRLGDVDDHKCLDAANGPITIWHLGTDNTYKFTCATKVIVSLDEMAIGYDGYILPLDEVFTLVDGLGQVYTEQEILDGEWPDTLWPMDESESHYMHGPL